MASGILMPKPLCLVENHPRKGLVVQQEALKVLSEVTQPVVVVAITGLYRTGKSYLMNRLAGQRKGFSLGSSVQSLTKGVWMWCFPHPSKPGHTLVLLDTEGLGDVEKGDSENDTWIFVLTLLLSSTLIYNSRGTIDHQAMEQLHYVMKLTEQVRLKAAPGQREEEEEEDPEEVAPFFPAFVWTVRDFTLRLEMDGERISEDQYLEKALALKDGTSSKIRRYNQTRECIRQYFWHRKCFVFDQPAPQNDLERLEELQDDELDPKFQQQVEKFCGHVWENAPPKTIPGGRIVTGSLLGKLAETYVETIRSREVPCLESAVLALAQTVNAAAVKEAVKFYQDLMEQRVKLPTETVEELLDLHSQCQRETLELFQKRAFEEDIRSFREDLTRQVEEIKEKFLRDNKQESSHKCEAALGDLSQDLDRKLRDGVYNVPGGHELFKGDLQALVEKYREVPGKGVMAEAVLQKFLQSREDQGKIILKTDQALAEKEKELKSVREQQERAEEERKTREKEEAEEKQKLQDRVRSLEEESLRLRKELEEGSKKQLEEHPRTGSRKPKEWEAMVAEDPSVPPGKAMATLAAEVSSSLANLVAELSSVVAENPTSPEGMAMATLAAKASSSMAKLVAEVTAVAEDPSPTRRKAMATLADEASSSMVKLAAAAVAKNPSCPQVKVMATRVAEVATMAAMLAAMAVEEMEMMEEEEEEEEEETPWSLGKALETKNVTSPWGTGSSGTGSWRGSSSDQIVPLESMQREAEGWGDPQAFVPSQRKFGGGPFQDPPNPDPPNLTKCLRRIEEKLERNTELQRMMQEVGCQPPKERILRVALEMSAEVATDDPFSWSRILGLFRFSSKLELKEGPRSDLSILPAQP